MSTTNRTKDLISNIAEAMSPFTNETKIYVQYMNPNPEGNKWIGFYVTEGTWEEFKLRTGVTSSFDKVCEILKQNNGKETAEGLPVTGIENKNGRLYVKISRNSKVQ